MPKCTLHAGNHNSKKPGTSNIFMERKATAMISFPDNIHPHTHDGWQVRWSAALGYKSTGKLLTAVIKVVLLENDSCLEEANGGDML